MDQSCMIEPILRSVFFLFGDSEIWIFINTKKTSELGVGEIHMVQSFNLAPRDEIKKDLHFRIRDMVEGRKCNTPQCWPLIDPNTDRIYLSRFETLDRKGRHVQLRRLLFYLEYGFDPKRRIVMMLCGNPACINPAHMTMKGFDNIYEQMTGETLHNHRMNQISRTPNILTFDRLRKWHQAET